MEIFHTDTRYKGDKEGTAIALGYFDGVHIGHQAVIGRAVDEAKEKGWDAAVFTFTLEPSKTMKGRSLLAKRQKHAVLGQLGVKYCFEPDFDEFSGLEPEAFFHEMLVGRYKAKAIMCGENFRFGRGARGDTALLRALCEEAGVDLQVVKIANWRGERVSSSRIRRHLAAGDIEAVNEMLGRPYEISFPVESGHKLGTKLGFPTINQRFPAWMQPPAQGVYVTAVVLGGKRWPSATGYGTRPTVAGTKATCETFIPGFSGDLYGSRPRVQFFKKIADSQRFESPEALALAVQGWAAEAEAYFAEKVPAGVD